MDRIGVGFFRSIKCLRCELMIFNTSFVKDYAIMVIRYWMESVLILMRVLDTCGMGMFRALCRDCIEGHCSSTKKLAFTNKAQIKYQVQLTMIK